MNENTTIESIDKDELSQILNISNRIINEKSLSLELMNNLFKYNPKEIHSLIASFIHIKDSYVGVPLDLIQTNVSGYEDYYQFNCLDLINAVLKCHGLPQIKMNWDRNDCNKPILLGFLQDDESILDDFHHEYNEIIERPTLKNIYNNKIYFFIENIKKTEYKKFIDIINKHGYVINIDFAIHEPFFYGDTFFEDVEEYSGIYTNISDFQIIRTILETYSEEISKDKIIEISEIRKNQFNILEGVDKDNNIYSFIGNISKAKVDKLLDHISNYKKDITNQFHNYDIVVGVHQHPFDFGDGYFATYKPDTLVSLFSNLEEFIIFYDFLDINSPETQFNNLT